MIHFQPESNASPAPYAEAMERLRSVKKALVLVEMFEGRPRREPELVTFEPLFLSAAPAVQRCAEGRSVQAAGAAAAGIEALLGAESEGERPHRAALDILGEELRRDLAGIEALLTGRA